MTNEIFYLIMGGTVAALVLSMLYTTILSNRLNKDVENLRGDVTKDLIMFRDEIQKIRSSNKIMYDLKDEIEAIRGNLERNSDALAEMVDELDKRSKNLDFSIEQLSEKIKYVEENYTKKRTKKK